MRVLLLDHHDSFTHNIAHSLRRAGADCCVLREEAPLERPFAERWGAIVLSPGPGDPDDHPALGAAIARFSGHLPLLGVCLGMQGINAAFGGTLRRDPLPLHGKTSAIRHDGGPLFRHLPSPFEAARYHSLVLDRVADELLVTARTSDGVPMAVAHRRLPIFGVQFHPESYLTPWGDRMIANFVDHVAAIAR